MKKLKLLTKITSIKFNHKWLIMMAVIILLIGTYYFWIGFHNFDNAQNIEYVTFACEIEFSERNLDGSLISLSDTYLQGLTQIINGLYISIIGAFMLGYNLKSN